MPSMTAVAKVFPCSGLRFDRDTAFDLTSGTHVVGVGRESVQGDPCDIRVALGRRFQRACSVTYRCVSHPEPAVQPWAATHPSKDRNRYSTHNGGTCDRPGVKKIEQRSACSFQAHGVRYE